MIRGVVLAVLTAAGAAVALPVSAGQVGVSELRCGHLVIVRPATGWEWQVARSTPRATGVNPIGPVDEWVRGESPSRRVAVREARLVADVLGGCR